VGGIRYHGRRHQTKALLIVARPVARIDVLRDTCCQLRQWASGDLKLPLVGSQQHVLGCLGKVAVDEIAMEALCIPRWITGAAHRQTSRRAGHRTCRSGPRTATGGCVFIPSGHRFAFTSHARLECPLSRVVGLTQSGNRSCVCRRPRLHHASGHPLALGVVSDPYSHHQVMFHSSSTCSAAVALALPATTLKSVGKGISAVSILL
jgi:hypothetical protein